MAERDYTWEPELDPNYQPPSPYTQTPENTRPDDDPYYTQPPIGTIGTPESGYGWGGVDNPAYNTAPPPDPAAPPPPPPPPPVNPTTAPVPPTINTGSVPSISGANLPGSTLPGGITDLFNKQPTQTPVQQAYQDALLKFMGRAQTTPTLDDSILGPQTEVFRVQQQRNQERTRKVNAERAAATGQSGSGYLDNQINKGVQEQNFNTASFNANLLGNEMGKRREELMTALQLARATGDAEAERELRARLAQVSAAMQQQGLSLQGQLGMGDLALRLMQTQMGDQQFYDQLGIRSALDMENLNQRALQLGMGR